jgi:hypothetical protein
MCCLFEISNCASWNVRANGGNFLAVGHVETESKMMNSYSADIKHFHPPKKDIHAPAR